MRYLATAILMLVLLTGCAGVPSLPQGPPLGAVNNPLFVPGNDPERVWEIIADVVDDYFRIEHEEPVRVAGNTLLEGRLDTFPQPSATYLEPWRHDVVGSYDRLESTLQSMRRRATVRVIPAQGGFWVEVAVFKELENTTTPLMANTGPANFRYESTLTRVVAPVGEQDTNAGWIPRGRDPDLEQRILGQMQWRLNVSPAYPVTPPKPGMAPQASNVPPATANLAASWLDTGPRAYCVARPVDDDLDSLRQMVPCTPVEPGTVLGNDPGPTLIASPPAWSVTEPSGFLQPQLDRFLHDVVHDYDNFYSCPSLLWIGGALGVSAVLANTELDEDFQKWYQTRVRTVSTDSVASLFKQFGEGEYTIPAAAAGMLIGPALDMPIGDFVGETGSRTVRSFLVGGPVVLALQYGLGSARPSTSTNSSWQPFQDSHGVSGHAFVGALPFMSYAFQCDNPWLQAGLLGMSVLPGWSRINDNEHFLSQVVLGWSLALVSEVAVDHTNWQRSNMLIMPVVAADEIGIRVIWKI